MIATRDTMKLLVVPLTAAVVAMTVAAEVKADVGEYKQRVEPFLKAHCIKCHGPQKQSGDTRLDDLAFDPGHADERWALVRDQLRDGAMPPKKEPRPDKVETAEVLRWIEATLAGSPGLTPNEGNRIPHELLFGQPAKPGEASQPRLWRLSPEAYLGLVRDVHRGRADGIVQPFSVLPDPGLKDFAELYTIDQPTTEILLRNAGLIVEGQCAHEIKDGQVRGKNDTVREFVKLMDPALDPTREQLEAAVQTQFRLALGRTANEEEVDRFLGLYEKCAKTGDRPGAVKTMLEAVLLRADAMFRYELVSRANHEAAMLPPRDLARSISLALCDRREQGLMQAADKGELATRQQVADHVKRILDSEKIDKPRIMRFFRQYFEYDKADDVFKDKPRDFMHVPGQLIADTDRMIEHILDEDKDVFRRLLTTDESYVNLTYKQDKKTRKWDIATRAVVPHEINNRNQAGIESVYGISEWTDQQPVKLPANTRIGVLMQPSWLVAWSTNFDNDPVRRGRWIRERLLGGSVPALPIGVAAQVPDEPHRTFRDRLTVTHAEQCWKCHRKMDDLGLPFEQFDHFGRFRTAESVVDPSATESNVDKKGKPLGTVYRDAPLDTTGLIANSGDDQLDGPVKDPREMLIRIANSDRARQVFIRHVFRYFMGRNESLADAYVLQRADQAYVDSGGSFKALLVSLLTSDAFLYRSDIERGNAIEGVKP